MTSSSMVFSYNWPWPTDMRSDPVTFDQVPTPERTPDGRWHIDCFALRGPGEKDRFLAAIAVILHKSVPVRYPIVFEQRPGEGLGPDAGHLVHRLPVPLDESWLRRTTVLPDGFTVGRDGADRYVSNGWNAVVSSLQSSSARWRAAGWVDGVDYSGPVPPPRVSLIRRCTGGTR